MRKYLTRLCNAIIAGKFNDMNYRDRKSWHGKEIQTGPLFCSYGNIGYNVDVFDDNYKHYCSISFDGDLHELTIDDVDWKVFINMLYLEENDISVSDPETYLDCPLELETYTDAGEDMIIVLDGLYKKQLQEYIDNFDINEKVSLWWPNGFKIEGMGVPFDNMKEHYEDYEAYLKKLQRICNHMPY